MKKLLFIAALLTCISSYAQQTFKVKQVQGAKTQIVVNNITYEKDMDLVFVEVDGTSQETYLQLNKAQRDSLKVQLLKFKELATQAEAANVISDRPVGSFVCSGGFKVGADIYTNYAVQVALYFYSYQGKPKGKAELSITIPSFASSKNPSMISGVRTIVLSNAAVTALLNGIDNDKIAERLKAQEKDREIIR